MMSGLFARKATILCTLFYAFKKRLQKRGAPHKPVPLLSIIQLFEEQIYTDHQIGIQPELVAAFKSIWSNWSLPIIIRSLHCFFIT